MFFDFNTDDVPAFGRYVRSAQFKVIQPEMTLVAYEKYFQQAFEQMEFLSEQEQRHMRAFYERLIQYMLCLPASSMFHHGGPGGLFFHSLETATIFMQTANVELPDPAMRLAGYIAAILHDAGKIISYWQVAACDPQALMDYNFAMESTPVGEVWQPHKESLWDWCQRGDVQYLALKYTGVQRFGHEAVLPDLWRRLVPDEVLGILAHHAPEVLRMLIRHLDGTVVNTDPRTMVRKADRKSITFDTSAEFRVQPKRGDMHLTRRFLEFAATTVWNRPMAPFIFGNVFLDGQDLGLTLPFFRMWPDFMDQFRSYLLTLDTHGNGFPRSNEPKVFARMLEETGLLCPLDAAIPRGDVDLHHGAFTPCVSATTHFTNDKPRGCHEEDLAYFPLGARIAWPGMLPVRVDLKSR